MTPFVFKDRTWYRRKEDDMMPLFANAVASESWLSDWHDDEPFQWLESGQLFFVVKTVRTDPIRRRTTILVMSGDVSGYFSYMDYWHDFEEVGRLDPED